MADHGKRKRRSYSKAFKRRVVAETLEAGASVAAVARGRGSDGRMVFMWRRDPRFGPGRDAGVFLPVEVNPAEVVVVSEQADACGAGQIGIALASGHRLTLSGAIDVDVVLRLAGDLAGA